jgi:hypothetical protein
MARKKEPDRGADSGREITTSLQISQANLDLLRAAAPGVQKLKGGRVGVSSVVEWMTEELRGKLEKLAGR